MCVLYVLAFWGEAARLLPAPLDQWFALPHRALGPWWRAHVAPGLGEREQLALFQLAEAVLFGFLFPAIALLGARRSLREVGLRLPDRGDARLTVAGVALCIPFGVFLSRVVPDPWGSLIVEVSGLVSVVPEHFLVFGVFAALLLPDSRLPGPVTGLDRTLRGSALGSAALFGAIHVGAAHPAILLAALPLGLINAWLTLRTGSIWPAIVAHWALNLVPMAWDAGRT